MIMNPLELRKRFHLLLKKQIQLDLYPLLKHFVQ